MSTTSLVGDAIFADGFEGLLAAARGGSNDALGSILEQQRRCLTGLAQHGLARTLASKLSGDDLVQEVFLSAFEHFDDFRGKTGGEWSSWLRKILRTRLKSAERSFLVTGKRRMTLEVPLIDDVVASWTTSEERDGASNENGCVRDGLRLLPARECCALVLHFWLGWSHRCVGARLGCSESMSRELTLRGLTGLDRCRDAR